MNETREDNVWKSLLAQSAPTFTGDTAPPLGLAARVLAGVRETRRQEAAWERIGLRAIFASLLAVAVMTAVTFANVGRDDADVPVRSLAQLENVPVS
jgi:hypothetical protein